MLILFLYFDVFERIYLFFVSGHFQPFDMKNMRLLIFCGNGNSIGREEERHKLKKREEMRMDLYGKSGTVEIIRKFCNSVHSYTKNVI